MSEVRIHGNVRFLGEKSEIRNLELEERTTPPTLLDPGKLWLNTATNRIGYVSKVTGLDTYTIENLANMSDLQNIAWSQITSGKPTTHAGYGITDVVNLLNVYHVNVTQVIGTSSISSFDSAPAATTGTELFTKSITPSSASSSFVFNFSVYNTTSGLNRTTILTLYRRIGAGGTWLLVGQGSTFNGNSDIAQTISLNALDSPATASVVYYMLRCGGSGGTWRLGRFSDDTMGGLASVATISEVVLK